MDRVIIRVYSDRVVDGTRRRQGSAQGYPQYFTHLPPEKRHRVPEFRCPVGGEVTRDFWYSHDTGRAGDVKLCREHQVSEVKDF